MLQRSPPEAEARSQWPRAAHSGLMHCTVQPGKYCTLFSPLLNGKLFTANALCVNCPGPPWTGNSAGNSRGFCAAALVVSREKIQLLVVGLQPLLREGERTRRAAETFMFRRAAFFSHARDQE